MNLVFNELSLSARSSKHAAQQIMRQFVFVLRKTRELGFSGIRARSTFLYADLAPNYILKQWMNDPTVEREHKSFFKSFATKYPDIEDSDVEKVLKYAGYEAVGLSLAYEQQTVGVSFFTDNKWDASYLSLNNGELCSVMHASKEIHLSDLNSKIKSFRKGDIKNGGDLIDKWRELFPSLVLCDSAIDQFKTVTDSAQLSAIIERLWQLHEVAKKFSSGGTLDFSGVPGDPRTESQSTLSEFSRERTFRCPDGRARLFSWHVSVPPAGYRLFFEGCTETREMFIGYLGVHPPTATFN